MARTARKISESGVYHVLLRGFAKQTFKDDEDKEVFLNKLIQVKEEMPFELYAYCLMNDHVHLLIKEQGTALGKIFIKFLAGYVHWYNRKYERIGSIFQDRYKSEPIVDPDRFLSCIRFIHQNPVKTGAVKNIDDYKWSSHTLYMSGEDSFINTEPLRSNFNGVKDYEQFISGGETDNFIEYNSAPPISDAKLLIKVQEICLKKKIADIKQLSKSERIELIKAIKKIPGVSARQITRVTGFSASTVRRV